MSFVSAYLSIMGEHLDVDKLINELDVIVDVKRYKGEPVFITNRAKQLAYSFFSIHISDVPFEEYNKQIADVFNYLQQNKKNAEATVVNRRDRVCNNLFWYSFQQTNTEYTLST